LIALLLAIRSYREGHRLLGTAGIILSCLGLVEGLLVAGIVGLFSISIPTMFTKTEIKATESTSTIPMITETKTMEKKGITEIGERMQHLYVGKEIKEFNNITLIIDYVNITDKFVVRKLGKCYACSAKPKYKIVTVHLTVKSEAFRETFTPSLFSFVLEVDKGYQYDPIWPSDYGRQSWEISEAECLQCYCKPEWAGTLLPEEEDEGCIFFEILATTNPTKLIYHSYTYGDITIYLT
jgi:hypothetical protein